MTYKFILVDRQTRRLACCYVPLVWMNGHAAKDNNKPCINIVQRLNVCLYWKVRLAYPAIYRHFTKIILKQRIQINSKNITGLQPPPHRSQQVDWLRAWPWIWTREDREQLSPASGQSRMWIWDCWIASPTCWPRSLHTGNSIQYQRMNSIIY